MKNGDKIKLTEEQIKSIAEYLDAGMRVYVNKETKEIKNIIDFDNHIYADEELWEEDIKEIEENYDKYIEFEKMDSNEAYQIMEEYVETVDNEEVKNNLELGLRLSRPFRNFKDIIDESGEYRDKWFSFKESKYIEYVKSQLELYNNDIDEST